MLENINLKKKLSREEYKRSARPAGTPVRSGESLLGQRRSDDGRIRRLGCGGKRMTISALTQRLDPRGFKLYPIAAPRTYEQHVRGCGDSG